MVYLYIDVEEMVRTNVGGNDFCSSEKCYA